MCILFSILWKVLTISLNKPFNDAKSVNCLISVATIFKSSHILIFIPKLLAMNFE